MMPSLEEIPALRAYAPIIDGSAVWDVNRPDWTVELLEALANLTRFGGNYDNEPGNDPLSEVETGIPLLII